MAGFGTAALKSTDLTALLQQAAALCAEGLEADLCRALEREMEPDGTDRLLVRAGVGWNPGVVGRRAVGADLASPAGYALKTGEPVIANDLGTETRFRNPDLLVEHGVKRVIDVIVRGAGETFGVLEVASRREGRFT
ncbi:GAF domain-containing protein, partial [Azospirillum sp. B506]|uniref:GAF domain-containing protein n=1 Tax=Azospirillum sp. B506 TaxID=137721 RepID=UPI001FCC4E01